MIQKYRDSFSFSKLESKASLGINILCWNKTHVKVGVGGFSRRRIMPRCLPNKTKKRVRVPKSKIEMTLSVLITSLFVRRYALTSTGSSPRHLKPHFLDTLFVGLHVFMTGSPPKCDPSRGANNFKGKNSRIIIER